MNHIRLRSFCSPKNTDSAFYPIIGQMERAAKISRNDSLEAKLDKLDAMLAQSSTSAQDPRSWRRCCRSLKTDVIQHSN